MFGWGMGMGLGLGLMGGLCMGYGCTLACCRPAYRMRRRCMGLGCNNWCCRPEMYSCLGPGCMQDCCVVDADRTIVVTKKNVKQNRKETQPFNQNNLIFQGVLYKKIGTSYEEHQKAIVTNTHFMNDSINQITKIKVKHEVLYNGCEFLKITLRNNQDHIYACHKEEQIAWLSSIVWAKLNMAKKQCNLNEQFNGHIEANIMRKSQFLGEWELRKVQIDSSGLKSYRNGESSPSVKLEEIKELWTRFEYIQGSNYLVIKCKSNGVKYEYGIPISHALAWISAFYSLLV